MWNFSCELGAKVKSLITVLDNPINMAHLSKLFIAQLLISCNFDVSQLITEFLLFVIKQILFQNQLEFHIGLTNGLTEYRSE